MTMTLDEVRKTRFHMSRRNGYEVTDVDIFVDKVEATLMAITEHIDHAGPDSVKSATRAVLSATAQDRKHAAMARLLAV